ncbi:efflux RND transporter periplasmic adaptor subunit [Opitutia bacterium ISCC 51]|nr:efflux RND transporter periplasmic adaptor subunit [Opitutae bacterium ISCC 51]QXD29366.1 efflux RND transporter periplasmic adaptor subunit [Opitutae bacterium ISCC 52]
MNRNETQERPANQVKARSQQALNFIIPFAKKRPILSTVIGLVLVVLLFSVLGGGSDGEDAYSYYKVTKGDFLVSVTEGGTLQAVNEVTVRNEVDGNSRIIYIVPEGSYVKKGDLIVELDIADVENALNAQLIRFEDDNADFVRSETDLVITKSSRDSDIRQAELAVQFAKMDLEKFEKIEKAQEVRNADIEIITSQESLKLAEERLEWSKRLQEEGFETKSNLDRDQLSVINQQMGLEQAQTVKEMLNQYDLEKLEAEYRADLEEAEQELVRVKTQGDSRVRQAESQLEIDKRQLELGRVKLAKLQAQMAATKRYAPQDGLLVYAMSSSRYSNESMIEEGATIRQRQAIVKIPDTSQMKVEIKVHESYVNQVRVGQTAFIVLDSLPDDRFRGEVTKIAVLPDAQSRYGNSNLKVYSTEIVITDELPDVKPGVSARAEIVITNLEDVIKVPIQCVTTLGGKQVCYVKGLRGPKATPVEIGLFNNKFIEVKSGLSSGDRTLLAPPVDSGDDLGGALLNEEENIDLKNSISSKRPEPKPTQQARSPQNEQRQKSGKGDKKTRGKSDS